MTFKASSNYGGGIHITGRATVRANGFETPYSFDIFQHSYDEVVLSLRNHLYQPGTSSERYQTFSVHKAPKLSAGRRVVTHPDGTAAAFLSALSVSQDSTIEEVMVHSVLSRALSR